MARLLADAEKISGVKYDMSNLSDVYNAIHVIQGELDITGTTAKESAATFSGSLASMKASFSNLLAGLTLGQDITPALQALTSSVMTFVTGNFLPMLWNIVKGVPTVVQEIIKGVANIDWLGTATTMISGLKNSVATASSKYLTSDTAVIPTFLNSITAKLPDVLKKGVDIVTKIVSGIVGNIPQVVNSAGKVMNNFLTFILDNLPRVLQAGTKILTNVVNGIVNNLPAIVTTATKVVNKLLTTFTEKLPSILSAGAKMLSNVVSGIINNLPTIVSAAARIISNLLATFTSNLPKILQAGITMLGKLAAGLIQAIPNLVAKIPTIISNVVSAFTKHDWGAIGKDIIAGIAKGITNGVSSIVEAAKEAAGSAFKAAKEKLGIKSPSRVMRDGVGKWIPAGIAVGIEKNASMVTKAMNDLTKEATGTINADVSMGISRSKYGKLAGTEGRNANRGFQQNVNIYSPKELSPSEVARQTRNATRNMVLSLQGA